MREFLSFKYSLQKRRATVMPNSIQHYKCSQEEEEEDILKVKVYAFFFDDSYLT